jgi:hypothetical protein
MARGDLYALAVEAHKFLAMDSKVYREFYVDKNVHVFSASYEQVRSEAYKQIATKFKDISSSDKNLVSRAIAVYVAELYNGFKFSKARSVDIDLQGDERSFSATITQKLGASKSPFQIINDTKKEPQADLVNRLNTILKPHDTDHKNFSADNFLDSGHSVGVADRFIDEALSDTYAAARANPELAKLVKNYMRIRMSSKFMGNSKVFTIEVSEESARGNRSKGSSEEKRRLAVIRSRVAKFIAKNVSWGTQKGSDSQLEHIENTLIKEFSSINGYKGVKPKKSDTKAASSEKTVTAKVSATSSKNQTKLTVRRPAPSRINLVALLNSKLTEEVKSRMTYPRLQNRTGRFADSVRVIAETKGIISYTYMKSPYQVFEQGSGRTPWASPDRDPRRLIDESIRSIAAGIAANKFYTRRV